VSERERALAMVRGARRQLETLRVLRGASIGALLAAALGLLLVLLDKATAAAVLPALGAWWLTLAGALTGAAATIARPAIPAVAAALYLDRRCGTEERYVTLWSLPGDRHADEWARGVSDVQRLPRIPLPREAGLVPVALFLLFGAELLPTASASTPMSREAVARTTEAAAVPDAPAASRNEDMAGKRIDDAAKTLRKPGALDPRAAEKIERAIDEAFARPEERKAARVELEKARRGDRGAQERLAKALLDGVGTLAESERGPIVPRAPATNGAPGTATSSPYPEEAAFLRAYDVELARLLRRERGNG